MFPFDIATRIARSTILSGSHVAREQNATCIRTWTCTKRKMPITSPAQLVDEFKKSGEFDRLRRELLIQFQQSDGFATFKSKTEDIARQRLTSDNTLRYMPPETVQRELMQELDRYPIVERAVADLRQFSDPSFSDNIRQTLQKVVDEDNKTTGSSSKKQEINGINSKSTNNSKPRRLQAQRGAPRHPPAGIQRNLARDRAFLENSSRLAEHAASDKNDTVITEAGGSANNGSNTNATKNLNLDTPESSTTQ
ncbi:hypothetical protein BDN72DRAFT_257614 [Pluteus cervinus]|uniref:Uncharacterized protein n=1 Tax=Pluteus cervinus TaxID=181527 RepID=A0ACD3B3Y6_9AGAR|nr:hypothetical protein BDN72DRAFT_257614 [Pluteus cervinus]